MKGLLKRNIETRNGFYAADRLKIFKTNTNLSNSSSLSKNIICLPFYFNMTKKDVNEICRKLNQLI